jgi:hypothetical protein
MGQVKAQMPGIAAIGTLARYFSLRFLIAMLTMFGIKTEGQMAPEIPLDGQRPAEYVFSKHVEQKLAQIAKTEARPEQVVAAE